MSVKPLSLIATNRFQTIMNERRVAALKKAGPLQRTTTPITVTDATTGLEVKMPGNTKISSLTLERGLTRDEEFITWADLVYSSKDTYEKKVSNEI